MFYLNFEHFDVCLWLQSSWTQGTVGQEVAVTATPQAERDVQVQPNVSLKRCLIPVHPRLSNPAESHRVMYYHTTMRIAVYILLGLLLAGPVWAAEQPVVVLESVTAIEWSLEDLADWSSPRYFSGIGWELGTAAREGEDVMTGGYTTIQDTRDGSVVLKHCFVLAAFDIIPGRHLLVCVRDPEQYWPGYDVNFGVTDPIDLVWYDAHWDEIAYLTLDYSSMERPDEFIMDDASTTLVAINKALMDDGQIDPGGHWMNLISLRDGSITDLHLPEEDAMGNLPADWLPVLMHFQSDGKLQVDAGGELRLYRLQWE
jgi:hypothetical protein